MDKRLSCAEPLSVRLHRHGRAVIGECVYRAGQCGGNHRDLQNGMS